MTDTGVSIEGLTPWVESGGLTAILAAVARWYDGTDEDVDCVITIQPWEIAPGKPRDLRPAIAIDVTYGPKGSRGAGCVVAWRGTDPAAVVPALDRCVAGCRAAHAVRAARGTYYAGPDARGPQIELLPDGEGRPCP